MSTLQKRRPNQVAAFSRTVHRPSLATATDDFIGLSFLSTASKIVSLRHQAVPPSTGSIPAGVIRVFSSVNLRSDGKATIVSTDASSIGFPEINSVSSQIRKMLNPRRRNVAVRNIKDFSLPRPLSTAPSSPMFPVGSHNNSTLAIVGCISDNSSTVKNCLMNVISFTLTSSFNVSAGVYAPFPYAALSHDVSDVK